MTRPFRSEGSVHICCKCLDCFCWFSVFLWKKRKLGLHKGSLILLRNYQNSLIATHINFHSMRNSTKDYFLLLKIQIMKVVAFSVGKWRFLLSATILKIQIILTWRKKHILEPYYNHKTSIKRKVLVSFPFT